MSRALLGVNLPYLYGSYGHDLGPSPRFPDWPCDFDVMKAYRPLLEAKANPKRADAVIKASRAETKKFLAKIR